MGVLVPVGIPCRPMGLLASPSQHSVDSLAHRASPRAGVSAHSADRNVSWLTRLRCPMRKPLHLTGMRELTNIIMATSTTVIRHETRYIRRSHVLCGGNSGHKPAERHIEDVPNHRCHCCRNGAPCACVWQGHLVFQYNPDESQRLCRLGRQPAASRRNVGMPRPSQQANRGVA